MENVGKSVHFSDGLWCRKLHNLMRKSGGVGPGPTEQNKKNIRALINRKKKADKFREITSN
ncbi:MAG: hypothetical protein KDC71_21955, partial [Acidobacteria bacterium]|nr:hypothetical protein [Acidobacteriota bacterium]